MARSAIGMARTTITSGINLVPFSYLGTGQEDRKIEVGFQPDLVFIKSAGADYAVFWTDTMDVGDTAYFQNAVANFTQGVKAVYNKGFTVGTGSTVNSAGVLYHGFAVLDESGKYFKTFTYTGNGTDNRNITGIGFSPDLVVIKRDEAEGGVFRWGSDSTDIAYRFGSTGSASNIIQSFNSDGFQVGSDTESNAVDNIYHGFCFKELLGQIEQFEYTGDGLDGHSITGIGFQPDFCFMKIEGANSAALRVSTMQGDLSSTFSNGALAANLVQAFEADGFQVGTNAAVNTDTSIYNGIALKKLRVRLLA